MENVTGISDLEHSSPGELFVFHEHVPTLQNIASHEVALQVWHHYISHTRKRKKRNEFSDYLCDVFGLNEDYESETDNLIESLKTARSIEKMLKESLDTIRLETEDWICYFDDIIFKQWLKRYFPRNFDPYLVVWHQSGKIDYKRSASKMLSGGKLQEVQKFIIMCLYGMADEIQEFPVHSLPEYFKQRVFADFEISYWISHQRDQVCKMLYEMSAVFRRQDTSIDVIMATLCENHSLPYAFEYFWNRLNEDEQISVAVRILPDSWELQKIILSKMSSFQQYQLVDQIAVELMVNFCVGFDMPENAFTIWIRVKERITERKFAELVKNVFDDTMHSENCMIMLNNVWDSASDGFKKYVADNEPDFIFDSFTFCVQHSPSSYRFFIKFLSWVNKRTRKRLILAEDADVLAETVDDLCAMNDVLNACLPKEADKIQYKHMVMKSSIMVDYCVKLLNELEFDKLITKVTFYSPNIRATQDFVKSVLKSKELKTEMYILDYEKWNKFSYFLDEAFKNDLSAASKLKKRLISDFSTNAVHCWDQSDNFNELVKVVEQVLSTDEMNVFKESLLKHFRKMISSKKFWRRFEGKYFNTFVSWCSVNENQVADFKNVIPADSFFDYVFSNICAWYTLNGLVYEPQYLLNELDEFLRYFCVSDEEVKRFKIRKFNEFDGYWFREVWKNSDNRAWFTILTWFSENDQEQVLKLQFNELQGKKKRSWPFNLMECCRFTSNNL